MYTYRCREAFDFSDHLVLYISHYIIPCAIELSLILFRTNSSTNQRFEYLYAYTILICSILILLTLRGILFTTMYFHTQYENIVGYIISILFLGLPVYMISYHRYWHVCAGN